MARPPKKPDYISGPIDTSSFSEEELRQLEQEAEAEFSLESKKEAQEAFKRATKEKLRKKALFRAGQNADGEDVLPLTIDLAPHSPWINIDGRLYYHGITYNFTLAQAQTINEIMARTWSHEHEIRGLDKSAEYGRRQLNRVISPRAA